MTHPPLANSIPPAAEVADRIGYLLRELKVARKLYKLAKVADEVRRINDEHPSGASTREVANVR